MTFACLFRVLQICTVEFMCNRAFKYKVTKKGGKNNLKSSDAFFLIISHAHSTRWLPWHEKSVPRRHIFRRKKKKPSWGRKNEAEEVSNPVLSFCHWRHSRLTAFSVHLSETVIPAKAGKPPDRDGLCPGHRPGSALDHHASDRPELEISDIRQKRKKLPLVLSSVSLHYVLFHAAYKTWTEINSVMFNSVAGPQGSGFIQQTILTEVFE